MGLNKGCGSDFVQNRGVLPFDAAQIPHNCLASSLDGDADRIVFYFLPCPIGHSTESADDARTEGALAAGNEVALADISAAQKQAAHAPAAASADSIRVGAAAPANERQLECEAASGTPVVLLDGDYISALLAMHLKDLLGRCGLDKQLTLGITPLVSFIGLLLRVCLQNRSLHELRLHELRHEGAGLITLTRMLSEVQNLHIQLSLNLEHISPFTFVLALASIIIVCIHCLPVGRESGLP
jgi:hypothetical protein